MGGNASRDSSGAWPVRDYLWLAVVR
jgi:hypothetical protein